MFTKSPFFRAWDPRALKAYIECGTYPLLDSGRNPIIRLKMPSSQEALLFSERHTAFEVWHRLPKLDERIELRWIVPGKMEAYE